MGAHIFRNLGIKDVDDMTRLNHIFVIARENEWGKEINLKLSVQKIDRGCLNCSSLKDRGVIDEKADMGAFLNNQSNQIFDIRRVSKISLEEDTRSSLGFDMVLDRRGFGLGSTKVKGNIEPQLSQVIGNVSPNSFGSARNQGRLLDSSTHVGNIKHGEPIFQVKKVLRGGIV